MMSAWLTLGSPLSSAGVVRWWQLTITVKSTGEKSIYLPKGFLERTTLSENWTLKHDQGEHEGGGGQKPPAGQLLIGKIL